VRWVTYCGLRGFRRGELGKSSVVPDRVAQEQRHYRRIDMSNESTQPFNINDNTAQPSHRPEHDKARDEVEERLHQDDDAEPAASVGAEGDSEN
jgi:hypothetical protein